MDAVLVPTTLAEESLPTLAQLAAFAERLGAVLVVLASKCPDLSLSSRWSELRLPNVVLLDMRSLRRSRWAELLPRLRTSIHPLGLGVLEPEWDTAIKRNVGLALARTLGWEKVLFLDDDIRCDRSGAPIPMRQLAVGSALLDSGAIDAAGWPATDFPDNSVVCHARRLARLRQGVFVGAGALLVRLEANTGFFPRIYNEDWLFQYPLLPKGAGRMGRLAVLGSVRQTPFSPFRVERAQREEFGDVLAEGLYQFRDVAVEEGEPDGGRWPDAAEDPAHWAEAIAARAAMIRQVRQRLQVTEQHLQVAERHRRLGTWGKQHAGRTLQRRMQRIWRAWQTTHRIGVRRQAHIALGAALARHDDRPGGLSLPQALATWVSDWRHDLVTWRRHIVPRRLLRDFLLDEELTPWIGAEVERQIHRLSMDEEGAGAPRVSVIS